MSERTIKGSRKCKSCKHRCYVDLKARMVCCNYILDTGHRRPCPAGDECTVYEKGKAAPRDRIEAFRVSPPKHDVVASYLHDAVTHERRVNRPKKTCYMDSKAD